MSYFFDFLFAYLLLYKYLAIFVLVFLAAVIYFLPTNSILITIGIFTGQGYFSLPLSLTVAVLAASLGDSFDYWLARRYGDRIMAWLLRRRLNLMAWRAYLDKHGGDLVILSRLTGSTSLATSYLAGWLNFPRSAFIRGSVIGNLLAVLLMFAVGFVIGAHWESVEESVRLSAVFFIALVILAAWIALRWHYGRRRRA